MQTKEITILQSLADVQQVFARPSTQNYYDGKRLTLITPEFGPAYLEGPGSDEFELRGPAFKTPTALLQAALDLTGIRNDGKWDGRV